MPTGTFVTFLRPAAPLLAPAIPGQEQRSSDGPSIPENSEIGWRAPALSLRGSVHGPIICAKAERLEVLLDGGALVWGEFI